MFPQGGPGLALVLSGVPLELEGTQYPGGKAFNRAAFTPAPGGRQGNLGRNVLRGFGAWQADVGLQRRFRVTQEVAVAFRAELFNIFNHPNFGVPNQANRTALLPTGMVNPSAGAILSTVTTSRQIQFGLKLTF